MSRLNLAILIGGKSTEHEISLRSGRSIIQALNKEKYNVSIIGIDKNGRWFLYESEDFLDHADDNKNICLKPSTNQVYLDTDGINTYLHAKESNKTLCQIDVVFPALHGAYGEDGVVQGLFRSVNVAFVGVDLLASAVGMDKDIAKRLWRDAGIPIAKFVIVTSSNKSEVTYDDLVNELGEVMFVKPANAGSSVGVHKVTNANEFVAAIEDALNYDRKLLVEEAVVGIEVECAIVGNSNPKASVIGGIVPTDKFYSYDAKYISTTGAKLMLPVPMEEKLSTYIQETAIKAYTCIGAEGLSRVDFFLKEDNTIILNEINTLPGFTSISMYPKLWEASGIPYSELLDKLINLGIERHQEIKNLKTVW